MIKKFLNFLSRMFKITTIKGLIRAIAIVSFSIFLLLAIVILIVEKAAVKRINDVVDVNLSTEIIVNNIVDSFNRATYYAFTNSNKLDFSYARKIFNTELEKSLHFINKYLKNENYRANPQFRELYKEFLDFKIYISNYKMLFNRLITYKETLARMKYSRRFIVNRIDKTIFSLRNKISVRLTSGNIEYEESMYLKQALVDLLMFNEGLKDINNDLNDYLSTYKGRKYPRFDVDHRLSRLNFTLSNIFLVIPEYASDLQVVFDSFKNFKESIGKEIIMIEKEYRIEQDANFTFDVLESLGSEILSEVNEKIRYLKDNFAIFVNTALFFIIAATAILTIFSVILFFQIMKSRIFRPLDILLDAIKMTGEGNRDITIDLGYNDEFKVIAEHFNEMARSIREREMALIREKNIVEEQKKELEAIKRYTEDIIHASPNAIVTFDRNLKIIFMNKRVRELIGEKVDIIKGKPLNEIDCELTKYTEEIKQVIKTGKEIILNKVNISIPGYSSKIIANLYIYPLHGMYGGGAVLEIEDVTNLVTLEQKMLESQKMETVGLLAGGFAHDFNNLLTGIIGYLDLAKMSGDMDKIRSYLDSIKEISDHASKLVQQILLFSRATTGKRQVVSLGVIVESALGMIKAPLKKDVRVIKDIDRNVELYADSTQLTQAVLNIILNAFEAVNDRKDGIVKIMVKRCDDGEKLKEMYNLDPGQEYVKISVEDNGSGMTEEVKKRMFDPFFTTKVRGAVKGTGLGLSIVYRVVKNHEGIIHVDSEEGKGTRIDILLPIKKKKKNEDIVKERKGIYKGSGTIVLVDDEDMVRNTGKEILKHLGYNVITFKSGKECTEFLAKGEIDIDLIILDLLMPEMDGEQTLKRLSELGIKKPVLIASGYITLDMSYLKNYDYVMGMIKKPYSIEDLSSKISKIITRKMV